MFHITVDLVVTISQQLPLICLIYTFQFCKYHDCACIIMLHACPSSKSNNDEPQ